MNKTLLAIFILFASLGCSKYDDSKIWEAINEHDKRIAQLELLCSQINTNIVSLQTIVNVLQNNDYVTGVVPVLSEGKEIGYTVTFSKSGAITIYHGRDGSSATAPVVSIKQDSDGNWYWILDGEWLSDASGNKIKANGKDGENGVTPQFMINDGFWFVSYDSGSTWQKMGQATGLEGTTPQFMINDGFWYISYDSGSTWQKIGQATGTEGATPQLKIEESYWHITYDGGSTWAKLGKATGEDGDTLFSSVSQDDNNVYFTLSDGTVITIQKIKNAADSSITLTVKDLTITTVSIDASFTSPDNVSGYIMGVKVSQNDPMAEYLSGGTVFDLNAAAKPGLDLRNFVFNGLRGGTQYKARAYFQEDNGGLITWSEVQSFTTEKIIASTSLDAMEITFSSAKIFGSLTVESEGEFSKSSKLFYSDSLNTISALISDGTAVDLELSDSGSFSNTIRYLASGTEYHYAVVCIIDELTQIASTVKSFTTLEPEYVDLGLSVKWATCNLGAMSPEDVGLYYAWGDVVGQSWDGSQFSGGGFESLLSYELDDKGNLKPEYDAAHVSFGGNWRLPTKDECNELINNSTAKWTTLNGIYGKLVTSTKTGYTDKSIFFPTSGTGIGQSLVNYKVPSGYGFIWTSSYKEDTTAVAVWALNYSSFSSNNYVVSQKARNDGGCIRAILEK